MKRILGIIMLFLSMVLVQNLKAQGQQSITLNRLEAVVKPIGKKITPSKKSNGQVKSMFHGYSNTDSVDISIILQLQVDSTTSPDTLVIVAGSTAKKQDLIVKKIPFKNSSDLYLRKDYARVTIKNCPFSGTMYLSAQVINGTATRSNKISKTLKLKRP